MREHLHDMSKPHNAKKGIRMLSIIECAYGECLVRLFGRGGQQELGWEMGRI
jgi:hypothetical protein